MSFILPPSRYHHAIWFLTGAKNGKVARSKLQNLLIRGTFFLWFFLMLVISFSFFLFSFSSKSIQHYHCNWDRGQILLYGYNHNVLTAPPTSRQKRKRNILQCTLDFVKEKKVKIVNSEQSFPSMGFWKLSSPGKVRGSPQTIWRILSVKGGKGYPPNLPDVHKHYYLVLFDQFLARFGPILALFGPFLTQFS